MELDNLNLDEKNENFWTGWYEGVRNNEVEEPGCKLFLKSNNIFFDITLFHPLDAEQVKKSVEYQRGYFESHGNILATHEGIPVIRTRDGDMIGYEGLDYLFRIYGSIDENNTQQIKYDSVMYYKYKLLVSNNPCYLARVKTIRAKKINEKAILPFKETCCDPGYTLYAFQTNNQLVYDTCLSILPPYGYYFEIYPHPSLVEKKYSFKQNTPILLKACSEFPSHSLKIELKKSNNKIPPLENKSPIALLIPRLWQHFPVIVEEEE